MKQNKISRDFHLSVIEHFADSSPVHRHNCFEIIYILKGRGVHVINENQFAYGTDDFFLLTPADSHAFLAHELSRFCIIDFTATFFGRNTSINKEKPELSHFFKQLEYVFQNTNRLRGYIPLNEEDKLFAVTLTHRLISEWNNQVFSDVIILQNIVFLLLHLIGRYTTFSTDKKGADKLPNKSYEMINYIQYHVYHTELLTLESLAAQFHLSKDYIGTYFKKQTGKTIRQFILQYKLELVKTRLLYSNLTISQIAYELNFTDESHLNKAFKKIYKMTAKQFKKKVLE